jgi:hypothetical protein
LLPELVTGLEAVDERPCASLPRHFVSVVELVHTRLIELHEGSMNSGTASNDLMKINILRFNPALLRAFRFGRSEAHARKMSAMQCHASRHLVSRADFQGPGRDPAPTSVARAQSWELSLFHMLPRAGRRWQALAYPCLCRQASLEPADWLLSGSASASAPVQRIFLETPETRQTDVVT